MTSGKTETVRLGLAALAVFRGILDDPAVAAFRALLDSAGEPVHCRVNLYGEFAGRLLAAGGNWSEYLLGRILRDENPYIVSVAAGDEPSAVLSRAAEAELSALEAAGRIIGAELAAEIESPVPLAEWETSAPDYRAAYREYAARIRETGYGIFAEYYVFRLDGNELVPVRHPDPVDARDLTGYAREREAVMANTRALVEGRPAANVLLYGDSGTGKSASVKAAANQFRSRGLRLIELRKDQVNEIPALVDRLNRNPLKFILFIDDLSFSHESDRFTALKAILEGSAAARAANTVVYATSNRRHFVRESAAARDADDIHLRDTLEETSSLSDRFGLTLTFLRPGRDLYLEIVKSYLGRFGAAAFDEEYLRQRAEAFALERGGRSARTARQFAESVAARMPPEKKENTL